MLVTRAGSPSIPQGLTSPHLQLELSVSMRSPPSSISSLQDEAQLSPGSTKEKRRRQVPASGRGGLGNIRARKESKTDVASPTQKSASKRKHSISSTLSPFRRTFTSSSSSTRSTISSGASITSDVDSITATFGSGFASISIASGSSDGDADYVVRAGTSSTHTSPRLDTMSEPGSPLSPTLALSATSSVSGSGKLRNGSAFKSKAATSVANDYVENLHADARQRALEKRMARERAKEARILASGIGRSDKNAIGTEDGDTEGVEGKIITIRSGRGGAGKLKKVGGGVDPTLHPRAADIAREYEERAAAQERSIVAASRLRSTINGSTGRGGAGNVGIVGKTSSKKKSKKDEKGKGRADMADENSVDESELTLEELAAREVRDNEDDATLVLDIKREKNGLRKLWKRVVRSQSESINDFVSSSSASVEEDSTPRPSMGDSILHIGRPSSPSSSAPSVTSSAHLHRHGSASTVASTSQTQELMRLRKGTRSREEPKEQGVTLLAFVNAALPDLPGARNVLGVPGTPGFPLPGARIVETAPSSRSSTPVTTMPPAGSNVNSYKAKMGSPGPNTLSRTPSTIGEDWVDDDTLHDADGSGVPKEEDEDEDSDIDPQLFLSIPKQQQQHTVPPLSSSNRPDSLDFVIRVALDKLDRIERRDRDDSITEEDEEGIIDGYTFSRSDDTHFAHPVQPLSFRSGNHHVRPAATRPPPSSFVFPSTPRCIRATAPILPARFNNGDKVSAASLSSPEKHNMRPVPPIQLIPGPPGES